MFVFLCSGGSRNILIHVELQAMRKQESAEWTETLGCGGGVGGGGGFVVLVCIGPFLLLFLYWFGIVSILRFVAGAPNRPLFLSLPASLLVCIFVTWSNEGREKRNTILLNQTVTSSSSSSFFFFFLCSCLLADIPRSVMLLCVCVCVSGEWSALPRYII